MNYLFTLLAFLFSFSVFSQSPSCVNMEPICTNSGLTFTAQTGVSINGNGANNYGCLGSQPNPSWYYLEIATSGSINMSLSAPSDIDFIVYGPYSSLSAAQSDCGNLGSPAGEIVDCSFSFTNNETPSIPNAVVGQVYVMLITNYANTVQQVTLNQTSGSGSTDCTILNPVCSINNFTANISACTNGVYGVTGTVQFVDPPTSGSLIIEDCNGNLYTIDTYPFPANGTVNYTLNNLIANGNNCNLNVYFSTDPACNLGPINYVAPICQCSFTNLQTNISACNPNDNSFTISGSVQFINPPATGTLTISDCNGNSQVFNAPFTSPTNYSFSADSDGTTNCSVTAVFSADPNCDITSNTFNYPSGCVCDAGSGTFNENVVGNSNSIPYMYSLCFGDTLNINSNGDFTPPADFNINGITYDPGMWLLVYNCPPSVTTPGDINSDPCLIGVYSTNDQSWSIPNNTGNGQTLYFVPVTMYSMVDNIYAVSISGGNWCYDLGDLYTVTFLPQLVVNAGLDQTHCFGQSTSTLVASGANTYVWFGGLGTNDTISVTPQVTTTYTVQGTSIYGCIDTDDVTITVNPIPMVNAGPDQEICDGDTVVLTAIGANQYTWDNGVVQSLPFNPSNTNTYVVTGENLQGCQSTDTVLITVNPIPVVYAGNDVTICDGETVILTGSGATIYTWDNGVINGVSFVPNTTNTYTVVGNSLGCESTDSVVVFVSPNPTPTFTPSGSIGCAPFTVTFTNTTPNSTDCVWNFSNGQNSTSCNPTITFNDGGCYDIMLTTSTIDGCIGTSTFMNLICVEDLPNANFVANPNPVSSLNPEVEFTNLTTGASNYIWTFGDESQSSNVINPTHLYTVDSMGNYLVTLIAYSPIGCTDTTYTLINVYEELIYYVPNTFTPDGDNFNQTFLPIFTSGFDIYDYNLQIYNRWGEAIFESNNHLVGWNGSYGSNGEVSMCQDGVYIWRIEFKLNRWDERRVVHGHVTLIR